MDREIKESFVDLQDISDGLTKAFEESAEGDRIILRRDQVQVLAHSFDALWDEAHESKPSPKAVFFRLKDGKQEVYLQAAAVAMIAIDKNGTAMLVMVSGANLAMEPLQWQMAKKVFLSSVEVQEIDSTHGLVQA